MPSATSLFGLNVNDGVQVLALFLRDGEDGYVRRKRRGWQKTTKVRQVCVCVCEGGRREGEAEGGREYTIAAHKANSCVGNVL